MDFRWLLRFVLFRLWLYFSYNCEIIQADEFEFVFAVPFISNSSPGRVLITTPAPSWDSVYVTLSVPGIGFKVETVVSRNQQADITLPSSVQIDYGTGKYNRTVIVRSSNVVSVHGLDNQHVEGDGFYVLPTIQLGQIYRIASCEPYSTSKPSFFCVSALNEQTTVVITTKAGDDHTVYLEAYESFRFDGGDYEDLTGTVVQTDKDVAVLSGGYAKVPKNVNNGGALLEFLPPENSWGRNFALAPFMGRKSGYVYRILCGNQSTTLNISNTGISEIEGGEWYEGDVPDDTMISIQSDLPVMVVQYMKGRYSENPINSDPTMLLVPPIETYSNNIIFPVYQLTFSSPFTYYVNVIIDCNDVDGLVYDDEISMADWDLLKTNDNTMCALRSSVDTGVHSVGHGHPHATFLVSVYAIYTSSDAYAYPAGFMLLPYTPSTTTEPPADLEPTDILGLTLQCNGTSMTAIFNSSVVPFTNASDVHMLDDNCRASGYSVDQAILSTSYHDCQTIMEQSKGHMIFRNALIADDDPNSPIVQHYVNIECRVERRQMADTSFLAHLKTHVSFSNFSFELEIYPDATYNAPYNLEDYPIDVKVGDDLYVAASVITVNDLDLFFDSCWATPTVDPWHETSYSLILNGCADDETLIFHDSDDLSIERFSFHAFGFKGGNWLVFIHCQLLVCDAGTPDSRCAQGCVEPLDKGVSRRRRSGSDLQIITSKPIVVRS